MKKLTTNVLAIVLSSSFAVLSAQEKNNDSLKTKEIKKVVVTALGIKREEKTLTYASQEVKAKDLNLTQNVDVKSAISGKVAGVQLNAQAGAKLGSTGKLRLRGAVSMLSDADPIYVLNGQIVDPNTIDMDNVATVNVLKGPNATALYGQRAQYGVVVMTLKEGRKNRLNVELSSTVTLDVVARTLKFQNLYGGGAQGEESMKPFVWKYGMREEWKAFEGMLTKFDNPGAGVSNTLADESWGAKLDGREYLPWYAYWKDSPYFGKTAKWSPQPNNIRDFYDDGLTLKNTISVSGGTKDFTGRVSFTNLDQTGIIPNSSLKRNYFSTNANYKFNKKFNVSTMFNFSQGRTSGDLGDGYGNKTSGTFNQWFNRELDISKLKELKDLETPDGLHASWNWWGAEYYRYGALVPSKYAYMKGMAFAYNPYTWLEHFENYSDRKTLSFNVNPTYKINKHLTATATFSRVSNTTDSRWFVPHILGKNESASTGGYVHDPNSFGVRNSNYVENQYEGRLMYKNKFNKFDLMTFVGGNITYQKANNMSAQMDRNSKVQYLITPDVYTFGNASVAPVPTQRLTEKQYRSLYANVSLGYGGYAYIDASARNDINSAYFNHNNSFLTFSLGGSLLVHKFIGKNDYLSFFKVRAGFAQVPSDVSAGSIYNQYRFYPKPLSLGADAYQLGFYSSVGVDPNLEPAINENIEAGVDMKFFKNRLSLSATYYNEDRINEPLSVTTPSSSGVSSVLINSGTANREGIELTLSGDIFKNRNGFNWTSTFNFARNKSTIVEVNENLEAINAGSASNFSFVRVVQQEGKEWGQLRGRSIKRDAAGNAVINNKGLYEFDVQHDFGSVLPDFTGGWFNNFSYRGLSLSAAISFQKGGKFFSLSEMWGENTGLLESTAALNDKGNNVRDAVADGGGVRVKGVDAQGNAVDTYVEANDYFKQFKKNTIAEPYIHDASFIKLSEVALNYTLPKSLFKNTVIKGVTVGVLARNPLLISVSKDNDHRQDPSEMSATFGENGQLPSTRGFGANIKINF